MATIYCKNKDNKTFLLLSYAGENHVEEFLETYCDLIDDTYWITYPAFMEELELPVDGNGYIVYIEK